jgi:hypothetical protein
VGYGDLTISHKGTHLFLAFYIIFSTVLLGFAIQNFQMIKSEEKYLKTVQKMKLKMKDLSFLSNLDSGDGISEEQFVLAMLSHLGTVKFDRDIQPWIEVCFQYVT